MTLEDLASRAVVGLTEPQGMVLPLATAGFATPELRLAAAVLSRAVADGDEEWLQRPDDRRSFYSFQKISLLLNRRDPRFVNEVLAEMRRPGTRRRGALGGFARTRVRLKREAA